MPKSELTRYRIEAMGTGTYQALRDPQGDYVRIEDVEALEAADVQVPSQQEIIYLLGQATGFISGLGARFKDFGEHEVAASCECMAKQLHDLGQNILKDKAWDK